MRESSAACTSWRSAGIEDRQQAGAARGRFATGVLISTFPSNDQHPGALVDLVLRELLALRQVDHDRPALGLGIEHLGLMRGDLEFVQVPALHRHAGLYIRRRGGETV